MVEVWNFVKCDGGNFTDFVTNKHQHRMKAMLKQIWRRSSDIAASEFVNLSHCCFEFLNQDNNYISAWRWEEATERPSPDYPRTRSSWRPSGNPSPTRRWPSPRWWRMMNGTTTSWYLSAPAVTSCRARRTCPTATTPARTVAPPCTGTDNNQESRQRQQRHWMFLFSHRIPFPFIH